jgi:hypothetical protein
MENDIVLNIEDRALTLYVNVEYFVSEMNRRLIRTKDPYIDDTLMIH